jgi:hypothetical protein
VRPAEQAPSVLFIDAKSNTNRNRHSINWLQMPAAKHISLHHRHSPRYAPH